MMERTNKEIKRRSRVVGAFPNQKSVLRLVVSILIDINNQKSVLRLVVSILIDINNQKSVLRLVVSILIDINEEWITGNRYIVMEQ